jgi:hypothetical protein
MTKPKQTSSAVSSIAGRYARMTNRQMFVAAASWHPFESAESKQFFRDIRKLAASCLAQDESKGQK